MSGRLEPVKVSVSLVTYNHERFAAQALDSILMQETDFAFDVVVGDDCSTDGTRDILLDYQRRYPGKIATVFPERNLGDAGRPMFVETIKLCRGQYIAMLDGDDYWTAPGKLQRQADFLDAHPACSLCYHDAAVVTDGPRLPDWQFIPSVHPEFASTELLLRYNFIPACSGMIRREVVSEFPDWFYAGPWADRALYLMASEKGSLGLVREVMGAYRIHGGGVWSRLDETAQLRASLAALESVGLAIAAKYPERLARSRAWHHWHLARKLAKQGRFLEGTKHLARAASLRLSR